MIKEGMTKHISLEEVVAQCMNNPDIMKKYPHGVNAVILFEEISEDGYDMIGCRYNDILNILRASYRCVANNR